MDSEPALDTELSPGTRVGEFEVQEKLAQGGMGAVYSAVHPIIGKRAAIKVIHADLCTNPQAIQRFVDEARAVNQVRHPNIVDIFAFGSLPDRRSYFVMEWLDGETLTRLLSRGRIAFAEAVELLLQLIGALEAAHETGVVHRDIKPDNVQLVPGRDGKRLVKLLDFGIAKLSSEESSHTGPRMAIGTPDYISPEQACGESVDPRSDIYSLGVVAYELFTGRRPFYGENMRQVMTQHVTATPPPPRDSWPEIPTSLERLLLRMLAKAPEDRPSLREVTTTLDELRAAHLLSGPEDHPTHLAHRSTLLRSYASTRALARPLLTDLSSGVTWTSAEGEAPVPGTPITVRYEVPSLSLHLDFGAILERRLSGEREGSQLVRFDRIAKSRLDRLFALGASLGETQEDTRPVTERWTRHQEPATDELSPLPRAETEGAPIQTMVISPVMGVARPASVVQHTQEDETAALVVERPRFGLGLKVMLLSTLVAVGAVTAVMVLALDRVRSDRRFYVDELVLRSSRQLADLMQEKSRAHREILTLLAVNEGDLQILAKDMVQLARCQETRCRAIKGEPPDSEWVRSLQGLEEARLEQRARDGGVDLALRHADRLALGRVDGASLLDAKKLPSGFSAFLLAPDASIVAQVGDAPWPLVPGWADGALPQHAGTTQSTGATPFSVGWAQTEAGLVVVAAPDHLSADSVRVLAEKILLVAAAVLLLAALIAAAFGRGMTHRLRRLTKLATEVGRGQFADTEVSGKDEVGVLARAFNHMSSALRERDEEVLRMRQVLSEEESRSWQKQMSEWLETDLSLALDGMREIVANPERTEPSAGDRRRLGALVEQAQLALKSAFSRAAMGTGRVDFAATVRDAVDLARTSLYGRAVELRFDAPNAVLFPRLPAQESELREIVLTLVRFGGESAPKEGGRIRVSAYAGEQTLGLTVSYDFAGQSRSAAWRAIRAVEPLLLSHRASASLVREPQGVAAVLEFPLADPSASAEDS